MTFKKFKDISKNLWKKFIFLIWKDNSLKGWIFSLIFIFILIKFIIFPIIISITGTSLPLAIVESCSMHHESNLFSNFNEWWEENEDNYKDYSIKKEVFDKFKFKKGFTKGDILFIIGEKPEKIKVGDVIIFEAERKNPIIHRVIKIEENPETGKKIFTTMGDNVGHVQSFEEEINEDKLVGKAVFKIAPYIGWGKLIFFEPFRPIEQRGPCK
jgi:hypothetical protein